MGSASTTTCHNNDLTLTPVLQIRPELNRNAQLREGVDPKLVRQVATLLKEAEQSQVPEAAVSGFVATGVDAMNPELSERPCIKPLLLWHHYTKHMQVCLVNKLVYCFVRGTLPESLLITL